MNSVMGTALSGMRAAQQGVQVAAHNVANLATPDAQRLQVQRSAVEQAGVEASVATAAPDASAPLGDLLAAKTEVVAFAANAALVRRQDQMLGTLLDRNA
ncbi:flagellar basal body protein [Stenotrophomonas sp.]|uniref:flagellar basal body protein n=1 Tax=Stenotrophomonas sp. TaxID=69392 RepID=UPI00289C49CC|nr:flagellar basal body protein [Stenotrophomonas sp.]